MVEERSGLIGRLRAAEPRDADGLLQICRDGFPGSPRWQPSGSFSRRWWETAIASAFAQVRVFESEDLGVVGLTVLVIDEEGWMGERRTRCGSRLAYLRAILSHPWLTLDELRRGQALALALQSASSTPLKDRPSYGPRTWIEMTAVSARVRRRGVANFLNEWCEKRSAELGRRLIEQNIAPDNVANLKRSERLGYIHTGQTSTGYLYSKVLELE